MTDRPRTSVLIPAFNEERLLPATLASVHESFRAVGRSDYEIVVCDNNSTDRTTALARAGGARVAFQPHNQMSLARNTAARAARGDWFIFLDADTLLDPALLRATLERLASGEVGGGGALIRLDVDRPGLFGSAFLKGWNALSVARKLGPGLYIYCLRRAWEEIGGFDETAYYLEDIFFSKALKRWCRSRGLRVSIVTEARVLTSSRKLQWYGGWKMTKMLMKLTLPRSVRSRRHWSFFYDRPR